MDFGYRQPIEWWDDVPLGNGENRIVEVGFVNSGRTLAHITSHCFITWGVITELTADFFIEGDGSINFANPQNLYSYALPAGTYRTPYELAAPFNELGYVALTRPFIRIRIADTALAAHAYTRLYAKVW